MTAKGIWHNVTCPVCGTEFEVPERRLRAGRGKYCSKSCGVRANQKRHGHTTKHTQSRTYISWAQMLQRCTNPNHPKFPSYGGKGIVVCEEWRDFQNFLSDMGERPMGTSIDRIDGTKGYLKANCRWSTPKEQSRNIKTNRFYNFFGNRMTAPQISRHLNVNLGTLRYRIRAKWPQDRWGDPTNN